MRKMSWTILSLRCEVYDDFPSKSRKVTLKKQAKEDPNLHLDGNDGHDDYVVPDETKHI
jgi:hypothetical protein